MRKRERRDYHGWEISNECWDGFHLSRDGFGCSGHMDVHFNAVSLSNMVKPAVMSRCECPCHDDRPPRIRKLKRNADQAAIGPEFGIIKIS